MRLAWVVLPLALLGLTACVNVQHEPPAAATPTTVVTPAPVTPVAPAIVAPAPGTTVITHP